MSILCRTAKKGGKYANRSPVSLRVAMIGGVFTAKAEMKLPDLKKQPSAEAVLDEHFAALYKREWNRS